MNETLKTIHNLKSVRDFAEKDIPKEIMDQILKASIQAANASARQNYSIIVVDDKELLKNYFYNSNKGLLFCVDYTRLTETAKHLGYSYDPSNIQEFITGSTDTILAAQTAVIAAKSLGIDSLFTNSVHRAPFDKLYEEFNLPDEYCFPLIALALGYAKNEPGRKKGRLTTGVIHYNKHQIVTPEEIDQIVEAYDNEENNLGQSKERYAEIGVKDYYEFFFTKWTRPRNPEKIKDYYERLKKALFFE
ncbi:MAG TPA: nitroreductase family protein [Candidatus Bathyarchaeia archaeon]|nr:nitroreductase family protein [Candidatus Bathyarchaeia archaeon]